MQLFRVFSWAGAAAHRSDGGALFVARDRQGAGRHDAPERYAAWYCSRHAVSAVAESIQFARGQLLEDADFARADGRRLALAEIHLDDRVRVLDLDDPNELARRGLRPSEVATGRRAVTQAIASEIFGDGLTGFSWWSTLEAEWTNVTLFHERALPKITLAAAPRPLSTSLGEVREAAERIGVLV